MNRRNSTLTLAGLAGSLAGLTPAAAAQLPPAGDPPYVPTPMSLVHQMLEMAGVGESDVVYDLGSGDGRIVIAAAQRGARGVGVEYEGWLVQRSRAKADSAGVLDRVEFIEQDLFETDVRDATVVLLYLGADFNRRLRPRLLEQLRPGARIVSHGFHMDDWNADRTQTIGTGVSRATMYYWMVPARVDGFWSLEIEGLPPRVLELRQTFQELQGTTEGSAGALPVAGALRGEAIRFEVPGLQDAGESLLLFNGRLEGGRLMGNVEGEESGRVRSWRAVRFTDPSRAPG
ncbi:MAG: class I SAM-dependent methyltransferase [Gemmatimonadota bacterium]